VHYSPSYSTPTVRIDRHRRSPSSMSQIYVSSVSDV
jgi:hypothetical protein